MTKLFTFNGLEGQKGTISRVCLGFVSVLSRLSLGFLSVKSQKLFALSALINSGQKLFLVIYITSKIIFRSFLSAKRGTISFIFQLRQEKGFHSIGPETCRV